ncbi:MAG TPA: hypothetical protein VD710_00595 [Nitrososphaeraceae archaeon]|nr:hypothetical protein [Nitrososphaeraceae archaeon]
MQVSVTTYSNFVNSINSEETKEQYEYCLAQFLKYCQTDLDSFLKLPHDEISSLIVNYLLQRKVSRQYKVVIFSAIKHACEMNDVVLNWTKMKKFIKSERTENSVCGKDRGYTDKEILKILEFSDQRSKTAFLLLASTGMRIGALQSIKINDLERIDNLYKITVYSGDREEYITDKDTNIQDEGSDSEISTKDNNTKSINSEKTVRKRHNTH